MPAGVTYGHNVVVSFTAQNQQALIQATQQANVALTNYNRTIQQNITQLTNVSRAQQSYASSLQTVTSGTTTVGRNVATMNSQFSAGLNPIRNSGNALNQFNATTQTTGSNLSKVGGFVKTNLNNFALLSIGITNLDDDYNRLNKAQVAFMRAEDMVAKKTQQIVKLQNDINAMMAKGETNTVEFAEKTKDLSLAQDQLATMQERLTVAQTNVSEATESFWTGIIPNAIAIGGSLATMTQSLGLKFDNVRKILPALSSGITGLGTAFSKINISGMVAGFASIGAPVLAAVAAIWFLVGAYQGLSNVSKDIIEILDLQVSALSPLQVMYLKIQDTLSNLNLAPKLTAQQKKDLNFYDQLTPSELDRMKKEAEAKGAKLNESFLKGFTDPKPITDIARNIASGVSSAFSEAFADTGQSIDPAVENALTEAVVVPFDRAVQTIKEPSQAISETLSNVFGKSFQEPARNSSELLDEIGIVMDDVKNKTEEWDKKMAEAAVQLSQYNNDIVLGTRTQALFGTGLDAGTKSAGEFIANLIIGKGEIQGFDAEMLRLSTTGNELATDFVNLKTEYDLTTKEAEQFFTVQNEGGDTLEYLAGVINKKAAPALEYFNKLLTTGSEKEFEETFEETEKQLKKMGLDNDTINTIERNAERKQEVFKAIRNMGRGVEAIQLIGIEEVETAGGAFDDITDNIIENFDRIQDRDSDMAGITGFEDYVKKVVASGDPAQLANLSKVIDTINMFWENDQNISEDEANIIKAMIGLGDAAGNAVKPTEDLNEAQTQIAENNILARTINQVTINIDAQGTAAANTTSFTEDLTGAMDDLESSNETAAGAIQDTTSDLDDLTDALEEAAGAAQDLASDLEDIPNIHRTVEIETIRTGSVQHGGSFLMNAQHGAGIITRPQIIGGVRTGEHSKPELITVTPLTNPSNIADQTIKFHGKDTRDMGGMSSLLSKILTAIEGISMDAKFTLNGNDIVRSKDIFASISPMMGKYTAKYGG